MLDGIDRGLIHALHLDARAPFSRAGAVLGVSTQTVARRYQRLRAEAGLRVVGLPDPGRTGLTQWIVRLTAQPATARTLARSLARRPDTSWVKLTSGGTEIVVIVHTPVDEPSSMLLHDIPRTATVTAVSAHFLLHSYLGGPTAWRGRLTALDEDQQARLRQPAPVADDEPLTPADHALVAALSHDGRRSHAELAAATGTSPATVARRLAGLRSRGALFFDIEVNAALFGVTTQAFLWMAVTPADLDRVATTLATHDELAVVAATTGPTNLIAHALCPGPAALHHYLTHRLGALPAIHTLHTAPVLETLKAAGPLTPLRT
jgi:DNA-binding Lrp family transcriptional regulator